MVTMPEPMSMFTDFCDWASRQPERAVRLPERQRPTMVVKAGLMDEERTMSGLSPVARMARPRRVRRNRLRNSTASTTAMKPASVL